MRQRKPGMVLLEGGGPEPAGKAKPVRTVKKGGAGAASKKKKASNAAGSTSNNKPTKAASLSSAIVGTSSQPFQDPANLPQEAYANDDFLHTHDEEMDAEQDENLYCICLERDDGRPLIQCEGCQNWCA